MLTRLQRESEPVGLARWLDRLRRRRAPATGRVTFIGAGPGDADLLTLRAVAALRAADVVLVDDLVSSDVLAHARRRTQRISVGKRGHRPSCRQEDINALMVRFALSGRHVARLKSGDPTIFGRLGEEVAALEMHDIPFAIVPGITTGLAFAAALGASLTHRAHAQAVRFVTGHSHCGGLPGELDWRALAEPASTTIFYMGGHMAARIAARLIAEGLPPNTPAAIGTAISRPQERVRRCTLQRMPALIGDSDLSEPVVIGVGEAFFRGERTQWERGTAPITRATGTGDMGTSNIARCCAGASHRSFVR